MLNSKQNSFANFTNIYHCARCHKINESEQEIIFILKKFIIHGGIKKCIGNHDSKENTIIAKSTWSAIESSVQRERPYWFDQGSWLGLHGTSGLWWTQMELWTSNEQIRHQLKLQVEVSYWGEVWRACLGTCKESSCKLEGWFKVILWWPLTAEPRDVY